MKLLSSLSSICILLALLLFSNVLSAQTTGILKGIITDEKGKPAAQATLTVAKSQASAIADADGQFELRLKPGKHKVSFSMIGYEPGEMAGED